MYLLCVYSQVNANGDVIRSEILGSVKMKCYLSGMPELRLGLNDKVMFESTGRSEYRSIHVLKPLSVHCQLLNLSLLTTLASASRGKSIEMEDVKFHQCVRLARFENDRTISFIPPDGEFELMSYRLSTPVKPLVWVEGVFSFCFYPSPPFFPVGPLEICCSSKLIRDLPITCQLRSRTIEDREWNTSSRYGLSSSGGQPPTMSRFLCLFRTMQTVPNSE